MEMVGEGQNQPKIARKRTNNFQKIVKKKKKRNGGDDRISELPDCLLLEILSRLPPTSEAIRAGTLSKRWKHLWTLIPSLIFPVIDFNEYGKFKMKALSDFVSFVDKTLTQCRQLKLRQFQVSTEYHIRFDWLFNRWIRYALRCNVEELTFSLRPANSEFLLDQSLYISSCFTHLTLAGCVLYPTTAISWKNLRTLSLSDVKLDEDSIENILSGSPLLETLVLGKCYGYSRINITSKSVKNLVLVGYMDPLRHSQSGSGLGITWFAKRYLESLEVQKKIIGINAPDILSLTINGDLELWKLLLLNVSSLVEANLNYVKFGYYETTMGEAEEEMLKRFILNLGHVKELKIGVLCSEVLSHLKAKGFIFPSNVKFPDGPFTLLLW